MKIFSKDTYVSLKRNGMIFPLLLSVVMITLGTISLIVERDTMYIQTILAGILLIITSIAMCRHFDERTKREFLEEENQFLLRTNERLAKQNSMLDEKNANLEKELQRITAKYTPHKDNPIKSNRIVSDKTFAIRLKSFAEGIHTLDATSEEERQYISSVADSLIAWQKATVRKDSEEAKYLEQLNREHIAEDESGKEVGGEKVKPSAKKSPSKKNRSSAKRKKSGEEQSNE